MSQIFRPSANQLARFSLVIGLIVVVGAALGILGLMRSDYVTGANTNIAQPNLNCSREYNPSTRTWTSRPTPEPPQPDRAAIR